MADEGAGDAEIQRVTEPELGRNVFQISTEQLEPRLVNTQVIPALDDRFGIQGEPNTQSIGPTFGETVARSAIIAIIASLIVISVYLALRFEWKYAVPVLIALSHDLLITAGVYSDRKSTRLNSSHANISYAVFCLKKKQSSAPLVLVRLIPLADAQHDHDDYRARCVDPRVLTHDRDGRGAGQNRFCRRLPARVDRD